ncbi:MAG: hypothetical protein K0M45_03820 [Candidatus Paracaedibacteraceae bacterium]|nr:hypothetical protein [Candidatus Paracaedibacteraceae bacterium]
MKMKILAALLGLSMLNSSWGSDDRFRIFEFDKEDKFFPYRLSEELVTREKFSFSSSEGEELGGNKHYPHHSLTSLYRGPFSEVRENPDVITGGVLHFYYQPKG